MTASEVATATPQAQDGKSCPNSKESSPVKVKTPAEVQEEATTCLVTGKRHLLVSDIPTAVTILAKACELLSTQFGETAKECAESYFYYGKALLELSRVESGVLGNALDGVPEEDDEANNSKIEDPEKMTEEEKNEVEEKVTEALEENLEALQKKDEETKEGEKKDEKTNEGDSKEVTKESEKKEENRVEKEEKKEENKVEKKEEKQVEESKVEEKKDVKENDEDKKVDNEVGSKKADESSEKPSSSESKESEATEEESMDEGDEEMETTEDDKPETDEKKEGDDEEPSNLQLAWEMLELAKVVYTKQIETGDGDKTLLEERLCSSILALGEVSLENENYSQAVDDIKLCLEKQKNLPKDSRLVAETHYQLGVAQGFNAQYDEAVESLNNAITIIKENIKKEISELEALVPEIEEKIADTKDMKKEAESKIADTKDMKKEAKSKPKEVEEGFGGASKDATKSVSTIAVKRKAEDDGTDAKIKKVAAESEKDAEKTAAAV